MTSILVLIGSKYHRVIDEFYTRTVCGKYGDPTHILQANVYHADNFKRDFYCRTCFKKGE